MTEARRTWTTYRLVDGEQIGEFAWVENEEFFEGVTEPTEVIVETWTLLSAKTVTYGPPAVEDDDD